MLFLPAVFLIVIVVLWPVIRLAFSFVRFALICFLVMGLLGMWLR